MTKQAVDPPESIAQRAVDFALRAGADACDAICVAGRSKSVSVREGEIEDIDSSDGCDLGLRVLTGKSQAVVSTSKFDTDELKVLAERAVAMAQVAPADQNNGLADPRDLAGDVPDLDLADDSELTADDLLDLALAAEGAGRSLEGVSASAGAGAHAARRTIALAASNGFSGHYSKTGYSISAAMIAGAGTKMVRDYDYHSVLHLADLSVPAEIGKSAGERTARRANPKKVESQTVPVVFEQRIAGTLLNHFAGAINGNAIANQTSFLNSAMDQQVFCDGVTVVDDGRMPRGHGSKPFDAEGLATGSRAVIDNGILRSWLLDLYSSRQLGLASTGNAARSTSGRPGPSATNLNMQPGTVSPVELIAGAKKGFLVTELIGMGVNSVTGDYSRGASGFWILDGEVTYPVSEITIAGNLKDMYLNLTPANDLIIRGATNAPTCMIGEMTIAGR
jgi:PmbA protein